MSDEPVSCPLCGHRFPARESCPQGCPLAHSCASLCCPNCHYRFVVSSALVRWVQSLLPARRA